MQDGNECTLSTRRMEKVWLVDRWQETGYVLGSSADEQSYGRLTELRREASEALGAVRKKLERLDRWVETIDGQWMERRSRWELSEEELEEFEPLLNEDVEMVRLLARYDLRLRRLERAILAERADRRAQFVAKFACSPEYSDRLVRSLANSAAQKAIDDLIHMDDHAQRREKGTDGEACQTPDCPGSRIRHPGNPIGYLAGDEVPAEAVPPQPGQQAAAQGDARPGAKPGDVGPLDRKYTAEEWRAMLLRDPAAEDACDRALYEALSGRKAKPAPDGVGPTGMLYHYGSSRGYHEWELGPEMHTVRFCCEHGGIAIGPDKSVLCPTCQRLAKHRITDYDRPGTFTETKPPPEPTGLLGWFHRLFRGV